MKIPVRRVPEGTFVYVRPPQPARSAYIWSVRRTAETNQRIAWELNEERVSALRRISQTLESLIRQAQTARDAVGLAEAGERSRAVATYRELRAKAVQYRWFLEVQREAMGLRHHHRLDEFYRIPPDVT